MKLELFLVELILFLLLNQYIKNNENIVILGINEIYNYLKN